MPWDNHNGWLGVKHQITYLPPVPPHPYYSPTLSLSFSLINMNAGPYFFWNINTNSTKMAVLQ